MELLTRLFSPLLPLLVVLSLGASAATPADVGSANSHLDRAEKNLELVNGSIGHLTSPPKGSAGKLARMRLDQADADLKPAGDILAKLTSGAGLAEAKERHKKAMELRDKLDGILSGKPKPKPVPVPEPSPAPDGPPAEQPAKKPAKEPAKEPAKKPAAEPKPKTVKLGYPHADNFKNAKFTLRRVEGDTEQLMTLAGELRAVADQMTVNHRKTALALTNLQETRRQAGFAEDGLAKIPANGEGVAEAKERLAAARETLTAAEAYFKPLNAQLLKMIDPAGYPEFQIDRKRLQELATGYSNPEYLFRDQRVRAAEAYTQSEAAVAECTRIAVAYKRLMEQETEMGKQIEHAGNGFLGKNQAFMAMAEQQRASLPADIRNDLAESDKLATQAVEAQKPMYFNGGIPQHMGWAEDKLALYEVLDPKGGPALRSEVEAMKASLRTRADSLRELIIRENNLPNDAFAGADRDAAIAIAKDAWNIQEEGFELLAVRIPAETWSRETKWTYSNGTWYFSDRSHLQVRLVVADKSNPELAMDRPINVYKDHQKGDKMIGVPMRSFDEELQPSEYFLRSKVK